MAHPSIFLTRSLHIPRAGQQILLAACTTPTSLPARSMVVYLKSSGEADVIANQVDYQVERRWLRGLSLIIGKAKPTKVVVDFTQPGSSRWQSLAQELSVGAIMCGRGWWRGGWYDGPMLDIRCGGAVGWVTEGAVAAMSLSKDLSTVDTVAMELKDIPGNHLLSYCLALRQWLCDQGMDAHRPWRLVDWQMDLHDAVILVMLRKVWPHTSLVIDLPNGSWATLPAWKRLFQNLGMVYGKMQAQTDDSHGELNLTELNGLLSTESQAELVVSLNRISQIIPQGVLDPRSF